MPETHKQITCMPCMFIKIDRRLYICNRTQRTASLSSTIHLGNNYSTLGEIHNFQTENISYIQSGSHYIYYTWNNSFTSIYTIMYLENGFPHL